MIGDQPVSRLATCVEHTNCPIGRNTQIPVTVHVVYSN